VNIGFEEILGLIFFAVFVIIPLFTKKNRPTARGAPPARPPQAPGGAPAADAAPAEPGTWRELLQEVRRRVAEAEAEQTGRAPGGAPHPRRPLEGEGQVLVSGMPEAPGDARLVRDRTSRPLVTSSTSGGLPAARPGGLVTADPALAGLGREGPAARQPASPARSDEPRVTRLPQGRRGEASSGPARTTTRTRPPDAARLGAAAAPTAPARGGLIKTGRDDLVRGMIWHEILSEPVATRRLRRARSRHQ